MRAALCASYCRNPNEGESPWCCTKETCVDSDPSSWDYCDVCARPPPPAWECKDGQLIGNGFDYDEDVAKTEKGQACKWWSGVKNERGYKYASTKYGFGSTERK